MCMNTLSPALILTLVRTEQQASTSLDAQHAIGVTQGRGDEPDVNVEQVTVHQVVSHVQLELVFAPAVDTLGVQHDAVRVGRGHDARPQVDVVDVQSQCCRDVQLSIRVVTITLQGILRLVVEI